MIDRKLLPRRVRLRLWRDHRLDDLALWLLNHSHQRLAIWVWKAAGLW